MKHIVILLPVLLFSTSSKASLFADLSLGGALRSPQGDNESYKNNVSISTNRCQIT